MTAMDHSRFGIWPDVEAYRPAVFRARTEMRKPAQAAPNQVPKSCLQSRNVHDVFHLWNEYFICIFFKTLNT
jgi:hypothetical protein